VERRLGVGRDAKDKNPDFPFAMRLQAANLQQTAAFMPGKAIPVT
jgi:hypothetical protein